MTMPHRPAYGVALGAAALFLLAAGSTFWYLQQPSCPVIRQPAVIYGGSLQPLLKDGTHITLLRGYYDCHEVGRGDLAAFKWAGSGNPLVKIVAAIPGDAWALDPQPRALWHIVVNGKTLRNSAGQPYQLTAPEKAFLDLYMNDYKGVVPENTYLMLGDAVEGSSDSRRFGLVNKTDVIGKVDQYSSRVRW